MKVQELRIGNLLHYKEDTVTVSGINPAGCFIVRDNDLIMLGIDKLKPIPITEEWLLKFGFEKNKNTFILNKDSSVTHEKTGSESGFWYSNDESDANCYRLKKIQFVHNLQNLHFSLTGEELSVIN